MIQAILNDLIDCVGMFSKGFAASNFNLLFRDRKSTYPKFVLAGEKLGEGTDLISSVVASYLVVTCRITCV